MIMRKLLNWMVISLAIFLSSACVADKSLLNDEGVVQHVNAINPSSSDNRDIQAQKWIRERKANGLNTCVPIPQEWSGTPSPLVEVPQLTWQVSDYAHILSEAERLRLESHLHQYELETGSQLAILTIQSLHGESIFSFAQRAACQYRLGRKGIGDGVLLIVSKEDRRLWLYIFAAVEPYISDIQAESIISKEITPMFQQGRFSEGMSNGMTAIMERMRGHFPPESRSN